MELELLKDIWQKTTSDQIEGYFISKENLQSLLKKRSNSAIAQIKRGLRNKIFGAGFISLTMILVSFFMLDSEEPNLISLEKGLNSEVGIFYLVFGLVIGFISVFNAMCYQKILEIEKKDSDLKTAIKSILSIINSAMMVKIHSDTFVMPVTICILVVVHMVSENTFLNAPKVVYIAILIAIGFGIVMRFVSKRLQRKRYGNQIDTLENALKQLET